MDDVTEVWKDVDGWKGLYQVSNLGRIKSLERKANRSDGIIKTVTEKILKPIVNNRYLEVTFHNGKQKHFFIHRLVASAFLPNNENKRTVNHINGIKTDNRLENLEWNTYSENNLHAIETGLRDSRGEKHHNSRLTKEQVLEIRSDLHKGKTQSEIAKIYNIDRRNVSDIRSRKRWKHI